MTQYVFANNASSTLSAPISSVAVTMVLAAGTGAVFPSPGAGQAFTVSMTDAATGKITEIMLCTSRTDDTLTVTRGQEGTTAVAWTTGDFVNNFLTAGTAALFLQGTGALGTMAIQNANSVAITGGNINGVEIASTRGATGARPSPPPFLGCQYFDTTLNQPIWCVEVTPTPTWVNAAGVSV